MHDSFDDFFRAEFALLVAFLIKTGFPVEAEDAAEEAMLCAYKCWGSQQNPKAWVYKVAYRIAVKLGKRGRHTIPTGIDDPQIVRVCDDSDLLARIEEEPLVAALLKCLPEQQRLVMAWHLNGFSHEEIAAALGKTIATVRSTFRHARRRLVAELDRRDDQDKEVDGDA